jgi:hypothetical protein
MLAALVFNTATPLLPPVDCHPERRAAESKDLHLLFSCHPSPQAEDLLLPLLLPLLFAVAFAFAFAVAFAFACR